MKTLIPANQFLMQLHNARQVMEASHKALIAAGAVWDGMDGYDLSHLPKEEQDKFKKGLL